MSKNAIKSTKLDRRTAKATLTRCRKALSKQIEVKRPGIEVKDALNNLQNAFDDLVVKPENYSKVRNVGWKNVRKFSWTPKFKQRFIWIT